MTETVSVVRKRIKNLYIRLYPDGRTVVSAPHHLSDKSIQDFIESKRQWIAEKRIQQSRRQPRPSSTTTMPTELQLWGQSYPLVYQRGGKNALIVSDNVGVVTQRNKPKVAQVNTLINEYYRRCLMERVEQYVANYQPIIGVNVNEIRSKRMKTKWGSCNIGAKRLWFNVGLAQFTPRCTEYVVVHEMTHLVERYHNRRFYRLVGEAMPDWQYWHNYLKTVVV